MARVEWTRLSGEDVEHVVAVLLCRENPSVVAVRPSRGDGGLDVLVPTDVEGEVDVYQVKKFASNLTSSQKSQIIKSLTRLQEYADEKGLAIRRWYLTMPLDPTKENLEWLAGEAAGVPFACEWRGLNFVEGLAAEYPDVVDYYIHGGADRLKTTLAQITEAMGARPATDDGVAVVSPGQMLDYLQSLQPLLDTDPHFRYGIRLDPRRPTHLTPEPGLVVSSMYGSTDPEEGCVTIDVYARFAAVSDVRAIPLDFTIYADKGSQLERDIELFRKYGKPFEAPMGTVSGHADLPGGLEESFDGGALRIFDSPGKGYDIRLVLVDTEGSPLETVTMNMQPVTVGFDRTGVRAHGTESGGTFDVEILTDLTTRTMNFSITPRDLTRLRPANARAGARFMAEFRPPHELVVAAPQGPIHSETTPLGGADGHAPWDIAQMRRVAAVVDALDTIQTHTTHQVFIPDLSEMQAAQAAALVNVARVLRGEVIRLRASDMQACGEPGSTFPVGEPFHFACKTDLRVSLDDDVLDFGQAVLSCDRVEVVEGLSVPHGDHDDVVLRPCPEAQMKVSIDGSQLPDGTLEVETSSSPD